MFGAVLISIGIAGLMAGAIISHGGEAAVKFDAKVVKARLDIKKSDGKEYYTYIVTFYIVDENKNISFYVNQKYFDDMVLNDCGILTCRLKKRKFISWELKPAI